MIYLDLADDFWRCIEIGPGGWRLAGDVPVRFRPARCHYRFRRAAARSSRRPHPRLQQYQQPAAAIRHLCRLASGDSFAVRAFAWKNKTVVTNSKVEGVCAAECDGETLGR
jgi:hypothetical protein